uniref:Zinc finger homeobox 2 n=1 Tax=Fundulus heteroclitus TaxID=8078 RepID=A0A3Q2NRC9_FUNHE
MDTGEGGGGDGGGGEERDADLSPQALTLPLLTLAVIPEQRLSSHTSAMAPAKESLTPPQQGKKGAEGSKAGEGGEQKEGSQHPPEKGLLQNHGFKEDFGEGYLSGQRKEEGQAHEGVADASHTGGLSAALGGRGREEGKQEEEAISNQSQTKSKCSLLPQQSQYSSSSSTAKASGTLNSKTAASPKPSHTPPSCPKPFPFSSVSPKHFSGPSSSSALLSETEVKDIKGDQGWISGFPQSFRSQQSSMAFPLAGTEPASAPAEDDVGAGVPHSSISNGNGAKAPEPNDSQLDTGVDDEKDKEEQKEGVPKSLNQDLSNNSLTSHMTIMHSRNSCKTLKCPKCNWHYKSQHTLQVHMKDKHPETGGVCGYCSSGKPHPRLARGETYACGYKPYRCEVCDYATSSKGNLSIHMQSDKHLNNVQNGGHANSHIQSPAKITSPAHSHSHGKRWRCDVCDYETSIARNLRIHTTSEKHTHNMLRLQRGYYLSHCRGLVPEQPVTLGSTLTPSPSPSPSPPPAPSMSPTTPLSQGVFQCLVCLCFSSDSLESVEKHLNAPRSLPQSEWCSLVAGGCHCRLCGYTTPLRANFSLHCQTDRHRTRYQLAAHLQEGGDRGQEGASLIAKGNPIQLRCNLCDFVTSSLEKLQGHSLAPHHGASFRVYKFLQQYDGEVDGGSWLFHCLLCNHSSSSKLQVLKHSQTSAHQQREGLLQLQPMGGEELAAIFTIRKCQSGIPGENVIFTVQCPLCQVRLPCSHLRQHLTHVHSVAKDCVDKLISAVCVCNCNTEGDVAAPKDVTALLTPPLEDNTTHPSNGTLAPRSPTQTPPSSPPTSPPSDPSPLSDRHGYRFRCSRCSLAFPTQEKLQLHWQYHAMRAATECSLCSRQCRSQEALQRHMQNTHSQQDSTQEQNALLAPHTVPYMEEEQKQDKTKEKEVVHEADGVEENPNEFEKGPPEEVVSEPSSSLHVKKSSNPTMDRYLDPSRPYKCTICSESFTQKTILLVHYNSVSHLHRARRALQDSGTNSLTPEAPRGPDPRPYRCRLCGVGYSQSSTLDIHLRSVLHQTRARAAQNSAPQTPESTLTSPGSVPSTTALVTSISEETSKSLPVAKKTDGISSSTPSLMGSSLLAENQPTLSDPAESQQAKKRVAELLASRNQLMLLQQQQLAQAQVQAQLQQQTALLQSQQLLLPFYLSGDVKLNPEFMVKSQDLGLEASSKFISEEQAKTDFKVESQSEEKHTHKQSANSTFSQPTDHSQREANVDVVCSGSSSKPNKTETEQNNSVVKEEPEEMHAEKESQKQEVACSSFTHPGSECPPPRVPYAAANGEPLRALLQSYGYEVALQYLQSRHRHQLQILQHTDISKVAEYSETKKEELDCGKLFSNALILKSHQEYLHRMLFPTDALEKFSKEYRLQYDQMYPLAEHKSKTAVPAASSQSSPSQSLEPKHQEVSISDTSGTLPLPPIPFSMELPALLSQQPQAKRTRTRISEEQLSVLRKHFDINSLPSDEEINKMSAMSGLPHKVIKHWFRNTLFKERQRDKDSPYNFNNPPTTALDESREDIKKQCLTLSPCSLSPDLSANSSPQPQVIEEPQRGRRSSRTRFTEKQLETLQSVFEATPYPREEEYDRLSAILSLPNRVIVVWFQNARQRARKNQDPAKGEQTFAAKNREDKITSAQATTSSASGNSQNTISEEDMQQKELSQTLKTPSDPLPRSPAEKPQHCAESSSQNSSTPILSKAKSDLAIARSPLREQLSENVAQPMTSPSSAPDSETIQSWTPDTTACLSTETQPQPQAPAQFQCSVCPVSLPSFQMWQEHQTRHLLAAQSQVQLLHSGFTDLPMPYMMLHPNPTLMASQMLSGAMSQIHPNPTHSMISHLDSIANREVEEEHRRDKRQRTTITPEQLEVLYQRYSLDSNPTRGVLESIARDVGLTRRVVQVWFQNTRARERKGQFRSVGPGSSFTLGLNHLRCPFCRALFKVKSALDAHMRSRHWAEAERTGYNLSIGNGSSGQTVMALTSATERPGPSNSSNPIHDPGYDMPGSFSSSTNPKNPEEDDDEYEEDDDDYPCEESSSMADQGSPSPEISGDQSSDWSETQSQQHHHHHQQQRQRTQMSHFQVLQLKNFYRSHRTPNRLECETLGQELGLPSRVVQVWFQNARAKEKRAKTLTSDTAEREQAELSARAGERDRSFPLFMLLLNYFPICPFFLKQALLPIPPESLLHQTPSL